MNSNRNGAELFSLQFRIARKIGECPCRNKVVFAFACVVTLSGATYIPTYLGGYGYALAATPAVSYVPAAVSYALTAAAPVVSGGYVRYETPHFAYSYEHPILWK
ncbi:hypothetical protein AVEN_268959-1 [Araneus ventricosus]|uniref:Uncharacterized protein n=1 Tax=Araneus ventricosus TaxID=182803 RepID=A0A4Y2I2F4_ARAVE|nr:hypothetical protein AVEN_268959-1 [Araneus ventricosus]